MKRRKENWPGNKERKAKATREELNYVEKVIDGVRVKVCHSNRQDKIRKTFKIRPADLAPIVGDNWTKRVSSSAVIDHQGDINFS